MVAIASLKMKPIYEASGSIEINKPDSGLVNFSNSPTFNVDYYDPTELETEVMILKSDLLAEQVVKDLALDRRPEFGGKTPALPSALDLAPDPLQADASRTSALLSSFRATSPSHSLQTRTLSRCHSAVPTRSRPPQWSTP